MQARKHVLYPFCCVFDSLHNKNNNNKLKSEEVASTTQHSVSATRGAHKLFKRILPYSYTLLSPRSFPCYTCSEIKLKTSVTLIALWHLSAAVKFTFKRKKRRTKFTGCTLSLHVVIRRRKKTFWMRMGHLLCSLGISCCMYCQREWKVIQTTNDLTTRSLEMINTIAKKEGTMKC